MSALCSCCRPFLPLFVILVTISTLLHSTESSATAGKIYSRGNHWAVGHLMGKKSIDSFEALQHRHDDNEYLRDAHAAESARFVRFGATLQHQTPKQKMAQSAHHRALVRSRWRRGAIYKYLREVRLLSPGG